jgi:hypothetical protein
MNATNAGLSVKPESPGHPENKMERLVHSSAIKE